MRTTRTVLLLVTVMLLSITSPLATHAHARSVHSTTQVDLFPQGTFVNQGQWQVSAETSFTQEPATYTETMVADQRLTMAHHRPIHLDTMSVWSTISPTDSNYSTGAPDGASTWSTGPEIELTGFDVSGLENYELYEVYIKAVIQIPDALQEDTVRISVEHSDGFDLLKTFAHTQGNVDYINNSAFTMNITGLMDWTWNDITNMVFTLDYVSAGGVDDSRLVVDAMGLDVTVRTPWYGGEVGVAKTEFNGHEMPVMGLNLSAGTNSNMALDACGLTPSVSGTSGQWESEVFSTPAEQMMGRVHLSVSEGELQNTSLEYTTSSDGVNFAPYETMQANTLLPQSEAYKLRLTVIDACVDNLWVDINDPSLSMSGRVFGTNDGIDPAYSRWLLFVNDELVSNEPMTSGSFSHEWPVGGFMTPGDTSLSVELRAWFTWDSEGNESHTALEVNSMSVSGGYAIQWDENPICQEIGSQTLVEDGGGIILPFLIRCSDDRTANEDLTVQFTNTNAGLVAVDLAEGDVRLRLMPEASGQAIVGISVTDTAGNAWNHAFSVVVSAVDDAPVIEEFQSLIPVERDVPTTINVTVSDSDSTTLTASTNRTWATVDLSTGILTVNPPTAGFQTVLLSVCDQTSCSDREIDLEVMALADIFVESIDFGEDDELVQGDIISMRVLVRNQGQADATLISVRCETEDQLMSLETIPILRPGELGSVTCDWQIPEDATILRFSAVLDRGLEIPEGNEENNVMERLMVITEAPSGDDSSSDSALSNGVLWVGLIGLAAAVLALIGYMMPSKIKKIE
ncbi:MAG: hypothetical protein DWC01_00475 [Candidatus Poseidoniales archaeon]|nr:MAG: hypothetical protein DWC01_00475 [Candidatus Poseidoniales archaeon]